MKKSFIFIISLLSLLFFSCASNDIPREEDFSPVQEKVLDSTEENIEDLTLTESEQRNLENILNQELENLKAEQSLEDLNNQLYITNTDESKQDSLENSTSDFNSEEQKDTDSEISTAKDEDISTDFNIQDDLLEIEEPEVIELEPPEEIEISETPIPEEEISESELIELQPEYSENTEIIDAENINISEIDEVISLDDESNNENIIEITDDDSEDSMESEVYEKEIIIEPSRTVTLNKLEYLDVTYPGKGWIFMGLTDNSKDITYFGRKVNSTDTKFSLQAKNSGTKILHFYKEDVLTSDYIDDFIEVIITDDKGSSKTHIEAPKYVPQVKKSDAATKITKSENIIQKNDSIPEKQPENKQDEIKSNDDQKNEKQIESKHPETSISNPKQEVLDSIESSKTLDTSSKEENKNPPDFDVKQLLENSKAAYNEKDYKKAADNIKLYLELSTEKKDAALYLQGQIYEAESTYQDIPKAIEAYTTLINNYPVSSYWDKANKRIIYLKRFYMEGR